MDFSVHPHDVHIGMPSPTVLGDGKVKGKLVKAVVQGQSQRILLCARIARQSICSRLCSYTKIPG